MSVQVTMKSESKSWAQESPWVISLPDFKIHYEARVITELGVGIETNT